MSNRSVSWAFRHEVATFLRGTGLPASVPQEEMYLRLSERLDRIKSDIDGVPWFLNTHCALTTRLSEWVDGAAGRAAWAEVPEFAVIHGRRGRSVADSYVTTTLAQFAPVLKLWSETKGSA